MKFFSVIDKWILPEPAIADSLREMSRDGKKGREGIVFWLGKRKDRQAEVSHLVFLRGRGVIKRPDLLKVESWLFNEIIDLTIELGVVIVGQIHSHGEGYGTNLSFTDRQYGLSVPYYLSVVAPGYALNANTKIFECGVHVFEQDKGYRRLAPTEINKKILVVPAARLPSLIVGKGKP